MLNADSWKEFSIGELFTCEFGMDKEKDHFIDGELNRRDENFLHYINFVTGITYNNGILQKLSENSKTITKIYDPNAITISTQNPKSVSFQTHPFCALQNVVILKNENLNVYNGHFLISILELSEVLKYQSTISLENLQSLRIKIPEINGNPDWTYMDNFMKDTRNTIFRGSECRL